MHRRRLALIDCAELEGVVSQGADNVDRSRGAALIDVAPLEEFERHHIPGALNLPEPKVDDIEKRFERSKRVVIYSSSRRIDPEEIANRLVDRGFSRVSCFNGGIEDWKRNGRETGAGESTSVIELDIT